MNWKQKLADFQTFMLGPKTTENFYQLENSGAIRDVMRQWREAYALWQMVGDPDLIDAAIFRINAAEKQYVYLMKREEKHQEEWAAHRLEQTQDETFQASTEDVPKAKKGEPTL